MTRGDKIKKYVDDNGVEIIVEAIGMLLTIGAYTYMCGRFGYKMSKPLGNDDNYFYAQTFSGKKIQARLTPIQK